MILVSQQPINSGFGFSQVQTNHSQPSNSDQFGFASFSQQQANTPPLQPQSSQQTSSEFDFGSFGDANGTNAANGANSWETNPFF